MTAWFLLALLTSPVPAAPPQPARDAVIVNSGSTNTAGFRVVVHPKTAALSPLTARAFFHDLAAAWPLDALPFAPCMKSASFGSTTRILWRGRSTPDLSCPSTNSHIRQLSHDVAAIQAQLSRQHLLAPPGFAGRKRRVAPGPSLRAE